jgi:hypothetical protein
MRRFGLLVATVLGVLLTVSVLHPSTWFSRPVRTPASELAEEDSLLSAAWEYHHRPCRHWRNCLLQRP